MSATTKTKTSRTHSREPSFVSSLSGWAQHGVQSFFATPRSLLDLAMRQNTNVMHFLRQQLSDPHHSPRAVLSEMAGESMTNFIEAQKVLLDLSKQQNEILMTAVKERIGEGPAAHATADLLRRSVDTFIHMQEEFLKISGKQTHIWVEAAKTGKPLPGRAPLVGLAREGMENFAKAQKQFLDVIAEETAKATGGKRTAIKKIKKTELSKLARQVAELFIDTQKKMVEVAGKQMNANVKTAGKTLELLRPLPKTLMDAMVKPTGEHKRAGKPAHRGKKPAARGKKKEAAAAAAA
jgi:hypothetical protein